MRILIRVLASLLVLGVGGILVAPHYEPGWRYDVRGVDVSHHQGAIDWPTLAEDSVDFAYIKATEGGDWVDPRFEENWREAGNVNVLRGAYHFFTLCTPGADQAANLLATLPADESMLPPAIDLEFGGNCSARPTVVEFREELSQFIDAVTEATGHKPLAYVTEDFYNHYLADDPPDLLWWPRSLLWEPRWLDGWTVWQYYPGARDGVEGNVDRNAFAGDRPALEALLGR